MAYGSNVHVAEKVVVWPEKGHRWDEGKSAEAGHLHRQVVVPCRWPKVAQWVVSNMSIFGVLHNFLLFYIINFNKNGKIIFKRNKKCFNFKAAAAVEKKL